ncbi:MAG: hypothetical protein OXL96_03130 [Candidatus Poribacteria bacterium]|nr:hypothetical protein [Candidatus Poribacteria bacterium]
MSTIFGIQKEPIFGSFGEFAIGEGPNAIRVKYILTKIKPGNDGSPECKLASQMKPWREVFDVEELDFNELLQRDLDDSRVAHDLIPYLLGTSGSRVQFFPPILAVIVPRKANQIGIEEYYPKPRIQDNSFEEYDDLFDFEQMKWDNELTPLAKLSYNTQRSDFIIVDGQHRAMAVLALHRQMNKSWENNAFASYYSHISVTRKQVESIELPTCIIYFPDIHKGNLALSNKGIGLSSLCREIFLDVNRSAKRVNQSRELLLDDGDIAARLMRSTLSALKKRTEEPPESARIYSISYGDSDTEIGQKEVISGNFEYSSAIALHKIHRAVFWGGEEAFKLGLYSDISDGRRTRNSDRPPEILLGTDVENLTPLRSNSGKSLLPDQVKEVEGKLGKLTNFVMMNLFDEFRPFRSHNNELQNLKTRLSDPDARAQIEQNKANTLIFEGSGVRNVFEAHFQRLKEEESDLLQHQIKLCESVKKTLDFHERIFQHRRACDFFSINYDIFYKNDNDNQIEKRKLEDKARKLFQTLSTQAFQLGYAMAIFTVVEELKRKQSNLSSFQYQNRLELVQFVTDAYIAALNKYFSPEVDTKHHTLTGYIETPRASVFDSDAFGLRGLLKMSVDELNERQWRFFRYALLEIIHSRFCWDSAQEKMKQSSYKWALEWYKEAIPRLVEGIISEREKYITDAEKNAVNDNKFQLYLVQQKAQAKGEGRSEDEIHQLGDKLETEHKAKTKKDALMHLKASLRRVEETEDMVTRLGKGLL